jgi:hypothetical protein
MLLLGESVPPGTIATDPAMAAARESGDMTTRDAPTPAPANGPVPSPVHSLTCLLVEDHTLIGQILASVLRGLAGIGDVTLVTTVNTYRREIVGKLNAVGAELVRLATIYNQTLPATGGTPRPRRIP